MNISDMVVQASDKCHEIISSVSKIIVGKDDELQFVLMSLIADGHLLLEDVPGVAKTLTAQCFAQALGLGFKRIQFVPDLLPGDITGSTIYDTKHADFKFKPGPVFANLILADEVNRGTPKTQSALLEAMQERQVTIGPNTYPLEQPFLVLATQNPIEQEGTYPLPEAQVDRFMLKVIVDYPRKEEERMIIRQNLSAGTPRASVVMNPAQILAARELVRQVYMDEKIERYILDLVFATRFPAEYKLNKMQSLIAFGGSPRASICLARAAKAYAFIKRRGYVIPEDVRAVCYDVLRHRIGMTYEAEAENVTSVDIITGILDAVEVP